MSKVILRLPQVLKITGLKRSSLYEKISKGEFPAPIKLGTRASGWIEEEVNNWISSRISERDAQQAAA
jgi:prophage regulatory protein